MYGHCPAHTVFARSSVTYSSSTSRTVAVRYLKSVGSAFIASSRSRRATRGGGCCDSVVAAAATRTNSPAPAPGKYSSSASTRASVPIGSWKRSPQMSMLNSVLAGISSIFSRTPRAAK